MLDNSCSYQIQPHELEPEHFDVTFFRKLLKRGTSGPHKLLVLMFICFFGEKIVLNLIILKRDTEQVQKKLKLDD